MVSVTNTYLSQQLAETVYTAVDKLEPLDVSGDNAGTIERLLRQCCASIRQELEHNVRRLAELYGKERIKQVLLELETVLPDTRDAVVTHGAPSISELIRREIREALLDAVSDLEEATVEAAREEEMGAVQTRESAWLTQRTGELRPISRENAKPSSRQEGVEKPNGPVGRLQQSTVHGLSAPLPSFNTDEQKDEPAGGGSSASGMGQEGWKAADDNVYEGKVRVDVYGTIKNVMRFMNQLSDNPELNVSKMTGRAGSITLWLALRQPLRLKEVFSRLEGVSDVGAYLGSGPRESAPTLEVVLVS